MWLLRCYGYDDAKSYYNEVEECMEDGCDKGRGKFDCISIAIFHPHIEILTQFTEEINIEACLGFVWSDLAILL